MTEQYERDQVPVVIVGAGFAGLGMAMELERAGFGDFLILEGGEEVGGTWRENTYPGCACDVPSHLYSFSTEPNPHWSRAYSPQGEILDYLKGCAHEHRLYERIRFGTWVTGARWDEQARVWELTTQGANGHRRILAKTVILGVGALSRPFVPDLEGLDRFEGRSFHSAEWPADADLSGKRVAVVGTGASAIQVVPSIAPDVERLHLFQRTAPWVIDKPDRAFRPWEKQLLARFPMLHRLYRAAIYWRMESRALAFFDPRVMRFLQKLVERHLETSFRGAPELLEKVKPRFTMGCKRILFSNDYYPALRRPNVEVVTDGIASVGPRSIRTTDGTEREVDAIVFCTGFRVTEYLSDVRVAGLDGRELNEAWQQGAEAYLGVAISGFPNLFTIVGPNTGLGHNSMVFMIEAQCHYVRRCLEMMRDRELDSMDVRPAVNRAFNERLQERTARTVWNSGCQSWYLDENGKNVTLWPGYTAEYWLRTREPNPTAFRMRYA